MKVFLCLSILAIVLMAAHCRKEGPDCHHAITAINNSQDTVYYATILHQGATGCLLSRRAVLAPGEEYEESLRTCWEQELTVREYAYFFVDPANFNSGDFYRCDSIANKNTILKSDTLP